MFVSGNQSDTDLMAPKIHRVNVFLPLKNHYKNVTSDSSHHLKILYRF